MQTKIINLLDSSVAAAVKKELDITLSLVPFQKYLEEKSRGNRSIKSAYIEFVLEQLRKHPDLNEPVTIEKLIEHRDLLDMIDKTQIC